jgi:hypothetical protein
MVIIQQYIWYIVLGIILIAILANLKRIAGMFINYDGCKGIIIEKTSCNKFGEAKYKVIVQKYDWIVSNVTAYSTHIIDKDTPCWLEKIGFRKYWIYSYVTMDPDYVKDEDDPFIKNMKYNNKISKANDGGKS